MAESDHTISDRQLLTIAPACIPPLRAGEYTISVKQSIHNTDRKDKPGPEFSKKLSFWVSAPRVTLDESDVYSVYPPAEAHGPFSDTLPHIVLSRRTLPWERALEGGDSQEPIPWMALLLLDEDDLLLDTKPREPKSRSIKEVPQLVRREPWEKDEDVCMTLDIPHELFQVIAPSWKDLPYLAHAREIGKEDMEAAGIEDEGWFSVIMGNRLPSEDKENRVYLVSLEGLEGCLPGAKGGCSHLSSENIRLVVLKSWRFIDYTQGKGFLELAKGLSKGPLNIKWSGHGKNQDDSSPASKISTALSMGYAPLQHITPQGNQTMSWYRGPLVPLFLPTDPENIVYSCADAALRYDTETGLLDVSYAAAWQLGRLLGLQNQNFARRLHAFKLEQIQQAAEELARQTVENKFGSKAAGRMEEMVMAFLRSLPPSASEKGESGNGSRAEPEENNKDFHEALQETIKRGGAPQGIPEEIRQWLGRLFLLHGVSLNYLVPHPKMLEKERICFFYVDTTWTAALLDGALSIGRSLQTRLFLDKAMAGNFLKSVLEKYEIEIKGKAELGIVEERHTEKDKLIIGHITGFLLRSDLVSGWRGLKILTYGKKQEPLIALRMERIAKDTMLCLYNGQVKKVVIIQPPHSLHFGFRRSSNEKVHFKKKEITVPMRSHHLVVKVRELAERMGCKDNPATFVGEMIVKPVKYSVDVAYKPES